MTKNDERIIDWRSTGRRKARRALFNAFEPFKCVGYTKKGIKHECGKTSREPPKDAPVWFEEIWPRENRVLDYSLQADHLTKDLTENDVAHLGWRCASCHRSSDAQTEIGESTIKRSFI